MNRLFDANAKAQKDAGARRSREEVRQRAEAVDKALAEAGLLDDADKRLQAKLSQSVQPIVYASFRVPGSKWRLEHARAGDDYVIQLFPLKPPRLVWQDVVLAIIATMDTIFPRNIKITYRPPREDYQIKYYTITVEKVVGQPGWERACKERALRGLAAIDVWSE
jgi:hypothetical protein